MLACAQASHDVVDGLVGPDVARGHVGHGIAAGQRGVNVGRRRNARLGVQPGERRRVPTCLIHRRRDDA